MTAHTFKRGRFYTRREIHQQLGGGLRDSLPHRDGRVVCGAFTPDRNPEAPRVVLIGGARLDRWAEVLVRQAEAVPIFLKRSPRKWEYVGDYRVGRKTRERAAIVRHAPSSIDPDPDLVLFLRRSGERGRRKRSRP